MSMDDIDHMKEAWEACSEQVNDLKQQLAAKQAQIDELMLEYCPDEMTEERLAEYARNQVPISPERQAAIDKVTK